MNDTRPRIRPWLTAGAIVAVVAIALGAFALWQWLGRPAEQQETHRQAYAIQGGKIVIDASRGEGDIVVRAGNDGEVSLERQVVWDRKKPAVGESWTDGTLRLAVDCPQDRPLYDYTCDVTYVIRIPADTAVRLTSKVGNLTIAGIRGDLSVDSDTGDIEVSQAQGALVVHAGTANVRLKEVAVATAEVRVGTGDVRGGFARAPRTINVDAGTGDVDLDVPDEQTYRVEAAVTSGEKTIVLQQQAGAPNTIVAKVETGDLRLR